MSLFELSLLKDFIKFIPTTCSVIPIGSEPVQSQPRRPVLAKRNVYETAESHFFGLGSRYSTDHRSLPAVFIALVMSYLLEEAKVSSSA